MDERYPLRKASEYLFLIIYSFPKSYHSVALAKDGAEDSSYFELLLVHFSKLAQSYQALEEEKEEM